MNTIWRIGIIMCLGISLHAQQPTYYSHIKPILDRHCVECHSAGGAAPFTLTSYEDVEKRADFIKIAVETRYMPPWFADTAFQTYHNQRGLSSAELKTIADWVALGSRKGKATKSAETQTGKYVWPKPDIVLSMQKPFMIPGDNTEQFRIFVIPSQNNTDLYISGIDFRPGNTRLAHHARLMLDTTQLLRPDDGVVAGDSATEFTRRNVQLAHAFWQGWVPGNFPVQYPEGIAKVLPKNADIILNMHYSPSPQPAYDQSEVRLYLSETPPKRLIHSLILDENWITNPPFIVTAGQVVKFYMRSPMAPHDISLINVMPHMHLLGKSFKAYAITPAGKIINLVNIPDWKFNWQMTYAFKKLIKLPKGSVVYAEAVYDNTSNNPRNPHFPPRDATYGWGTFNEMCNLVIEYLDYQPGDEQLELYPTVPLHNR